MCLPQHWLVKNEHRKTAEFFNNMFSLSLYPFIFKLTRITSESATLADINLTDKSTKSGWLVTDISDHLLVFAVFDSRELKPRIQEIYRFSNSFIDKNKLLNDQQYGLEVTDEHAEQWWTWKYFISKRWKNNMFFFFIDLSKAFNTINHS